MLLGCNNYALQCASQYRCGIYGLGRKSIKLLHDEKKLTKEWVSRILFVFLPCRSEFLSVFFATLRQVEFLTLQNPEQLFYCSGAYKNIKS